MRLLRLAAEGLTVLTRNRIRALFMTIGTVLGIASLTAVMAMNDGARAQLEQHLNRFGADKIRVHAGGGRMHHGGERSSTLTLEDGKAVALQVAGVESVNALLFIPETDVRHEGSSSKAIVIGTSPEGLDSPMNELDSGRGFDRTEADEMARVCLVGPALQDKIFGGADPMGERLMVNQVAFTVIGILKPQGMGFGGMNIDERVVIPISTAMRRVFRVEYVSALEIASNDRERIEQQAEEIRKLLAERHHINAGEEEDFHVMTASGMAEFRLAAVNNLSLLVGSLALLCMLVGGAVMMNILLVSVGERTREIGLRRSVGASRNDIFVQFLTESVVVNLVGMVAGIVLGFGVALVLSTVLPEMPVVFSLKGAGMAVGFSVLVGLGFGTLPARRAARLSPVEALR